MPRTPATERLRRLLAMIPWILSRTEVSLAELAQQFGISPEQVVEDVDLAALIGIPPYTADCQIDMYVDGDTVHAFAGNLFTRPPRLSVAEGFAVLAAGRTLLNVPGAAGTDSALAAALAKLEQVLGRAGGLAIDVHVPSQLVAVSRAVDEGKSLDIDYWSAWRDEMTTRTIEPRVVFERRGRWYVAAFSPETGDVRHYRIDRIRRLVATGQTFAKVPTSAPTDVFDPADDAIAVTIEAPASTARWVVESYPCTVEQAGADLRITLRVMGEAWLDRLLLRLGPDVRVVEPADLVGAPGRAAARVLAAYASAG